MDQGVEIVLGRPRRLRFRYQDMRALEERAGKPLGEVVGDLARMSIKTVELVVWAGLRHEEPRLRPDDVQPLLQAYFEEGKSLSDILAVLRQAVQESGFFAGKEEGPDKK